MNSARWSASTRRRKFFTTSMAAFCNTYCVSCWRTKERASPQINADVRRSGLAAKKKFSRESTRNGAHRGLRPAETLGVLETADSLFLTGFFIRLGQDLPERLTAIDDLFAA